MSFCLNISHLSVAFSCELGKKLQDIWENVQKICNFVANKGLYQSYYIPENTITC
jgi:hypothetical protein